MANNKNSFYDPGLITKEVHDFHGQYLRTGDAKSVVPEYFSHFRATYDANDNPTQVSYYRGTLPHITQIGMVSASGLDGKYFIIRNNPSNSPIVIWYNVDGLSTPPTIPEATLVEIPVQSTDDAFLVAMATSLTLNSVQGSNFKAVRYNGAVTITTTGMGLISNSVDFNTSFVITNTQGAQELVSEVNLSYIASDPVYNGEVLKGYYYDIYSGKFLKSQEVNTGDISVEVDLAPLEDLIEETNTILTDIDNKLDSTLEANISGTVDGTSSGTKYGYVYNLKQQILASHDREQSIVYADFGTKDQRIVEINYTSNTFPAKIVKQIISYTLISGRYRRDSINWSVVE